MTRVYGYSLKTMGGVRMRGFEREGGEVESLSRQLFGRIITLMEQSIQITYEKGRHAFGIGIIVVTYSGRVSASRIYEGLAGIDEGYPLEQRIGVTLGNLGVNVDEIRTLVMTLHNEPKSKEAERQLNAKGRQMIHPLVSDHYLLTSIGMWWNGRDNPYPGSYDKRGEQFSDEKYRWYVEQRPVLSVLRYAEMACDKRRSIDLNWIDPARQAVVWLIRKKDGKLFFYDTNHGEPNFRGNTYVRKEKADYNLFEGFRNKEGELV